MVCYADEVSDLDKCHYFFSRAVGVEPSCYLREATFQVHFPQADITIVLPALLQLKPESCQDPTQAGWDN